MRTITLMWDAENQQLLNPTTLNTLRSEKEWPHMTYKEQVLVRLTQVTVEDNVATVVPFPTNTVEYSAVIDMDYDYDTLPLVHCADAAINIAGDWESGGYVGNADPTQGQLSLRLDGYISNFRDRLETSERSNKTSLEIKGKGTDSKLTFVVRIPFVARNLMDDETGAPPSVFEEYGERWAIASDGLYHLALLFPDDVWRVQMPAIVNGIPTSKWEEVEVVS